MTLPHVTAQHSHRCSIIIHMKKRGMGLTEVHKKMMMEKQEDKAESAGSSCPSVRSDRSKPQPPGFSAEPGPTRVDQQNSEVPSGQSAQQHQTHLDSIFMVCTCTATTFTSILFTVISMLLFVDQWIVSVSNMELMFGSMISV
ncbi:uncharacterized protein LOC102082992 isoform X1 [Oreochromis niloticus]|uniref:uncharacterized protein LOC102082992 isoform X1 n=1 Tax=Oreochromis niloticus TaxID=8128 RepID=UPI000DF3B238|nr:uncharacterized protein LOC102082992 isoform X1 [Oreochromis niloticus]